MLSVLSVLMLGADAVEPNPPNWPASVSVFGPSDTDIDAVVAAAYNENGGHDPTNHGQFSDKRFAFLFKPGTYDANVPVGYYTQVLGLGTSPSDVVFTSPNGVYSEEQDYSIGGALSTFWRSAENFKSSAFANWQVGTGMMWAVSQAAPLRRIEVDNDLLLFEYQPPIPAAGEASGGFFANLKVNGAVQPGSQQQWFARDSTVSKWNGGVWNMVFSGVDGAPASHCSNTGSAPITAVANTPTIAEKPYITIDASGKFSLQVPYLKSNSHGADHSSSAQSIGFENVYVTSTTDSASVINAKLAAGLHVVISPGIYKIDTPLVVSHPGQVILGLGLATLISANANVIIQVQDVDNVRIAGILLQAGPPTSSVTPALLQWGTGNGYAGDATKPGILSDVFGRVGGPDGTPTSPVATTAMFVLHNGHVIIDNTWLWRADHAAGGAVTTSSNPCDHGLIANGDDITAYGLAVEHTLKDLTVWNGERGRTYFYQSELPYGVTQAEFGDPGYCGYRVAPNVTQHETWGVGVYCYFRDHVVTVESAIIVPAALEKNFHNPLTVMLNGYGQITHIINELGTPANKSGTPQYLC
jgi:hypothetical protein